MKEDNISQSGDYDAPFCEQQNTHGSCYISLFKFKLFDQLIPPDCLKFPTFTQLWHYILWLGQIMAGYQVLNVTKLQKSI